MTRISWHQTGEQIPILPENPSQDWCYTWPYIWLIYFIDIIHSYSLLFDCSWLTRIITLLHEQCLFWDQAHCIVVYTHCYYVERDWGENLRTNFVFSKGRSKRRVSMKSLFFSTILVTIFYFFVLWHSKFLSRSLRNHWKYYWENNRKYQCGNHWKYYVAFHLLWHASTVTSTMCVLRSVCCAGPSIMVRLVSLLW